MIRRYAAALALALGATGPALAQDDAGTPYAQAFCVLAGAENGMGRLYLVSPGLNEAITTALAENARLQAENPDEKPPLGDGVPWQSYPDVAPVCEPGATTADGDALVVEVDYTFPDGSGEGWTDRLRLVKSADGAYVIDDVLYGAEGGDSLRTALRDAFAG